MSLLYAGVLVFLLLTTSVFAAGYGEAKPIDELMLMNDSELDSEAHSACVHAVVSRRYGMEKKVIDATNYLDTLLRVARSKHHEEGPQWMNEYRLRAGGDDTDKCNEIAMKSMMERANAASQAERKRRTR